MGSHRAASADGIAQLEAPHFVAAPRLQRKYEIRLSLDPDSTNQDFAARA